MKNFFKEYKKGSHQFGQDIAFLVNTILLLIVYFIGVGITSIIAKILKKKFLDTDLSNKTYWKDINLGKKSIESYYKQF